MKKKLIKTAGLLFSLFAFASCDVGSENSSCPAIIGNSTTAVTGPTEAAISQEITLSVSYKTAAACGDFVRFYVEPDGLNTEKTLIVNATYDACNCDNVYTTEIEPYKFKETTAGTYKLKFKTTDTTFVTHVVTVE